MSKIPSYLFMQHGLYKENYSLYAFIVERLVEEKGFTLIDAKLIVDYQRSKDKVIHERWESEARMLNDYVLALVWSMTEKALLSWIDEEAPNHWAKEFFDRRSPI